MRRWLVLSRLAAANSHSHAGGSFAPADATASMNEARAFAVATLLRNGQVLIAGGINNSGYLASVDLYDPATNTFPGPVRHPR